MTEQNRIAYLKIQYRNKTSVHEFIYDTLTCYQTMIAPSDEHMEYAIKNYAMKIGAVAIETISPEQYQEATNESKT